jgi:hypothetical protein
MNFTKRFISVALILLSFFAASAASAGIVGSIDSVFDSVAIGYACLYGDATDHQDEIYIYAGGPMGTGTQVATGWAAYPTYDAWDAANYLTPLCGTPTTMHRFAIGLLPAAVAYSGSNTYLWVYDYNPTIGYTLLTNSGTYKLPAKPPTPGGGGSFPFSNIKALLDSGQNQVEILFVGDSHIASFGDPSWGTGGADSNSMVWKLGMLLGAKYTNYKVLIYQRRTVYTFTNSIEGAASVLGVSSCGTSEEDDEGFIANSTASKTLILIQDGVGGSNLERYMARLSTTAPSGSPVPLAQSVTGNLPGSLVMAPDAVIMMFGFNDSQERYTADLDLACYKNYGTAGNVTMSGSYGNAQLNYRGLNNAPPAVAQSGMPAPPSVFYTDFEKAYEAAIAGTKSAFNALSGKTPIVALMTPLNVPGVLYDGRGPSSTPPTSTYTGHLGYNNQFCSLCTTASPSWYTGPVNGQLVPNAGDLTTWALSLKEYQDSVFYAAGVASVNVLDLFAWFNFPVPDSTDFIENPATRGSGFDVHFSPAGNGNIAKMIYNYGFGLN